GDGLRPFEGDDVLDVVEAVQRAHRLLATPAAAIAIWVHGAHDTGDAWLGGPAPRVAGQRDRPSSGTMVGPIASNDLLAPRYPAGDLDRILIRLRAAIGEEGLGKIAWRDLLQQAPQLGARRGGRRSWGHVTDALELFPDGVDDAFVAVAEIVAHKLGVEVHIPFAIGIPEVD